MKVLETKTSLVSALEQEKNKHHSIGFVPTMGALHQGHISLVRQCKEENDIAVVSIFVNPTQFNDKNDLAKYPRDLPCDLKMLEENGCDYVFAPSVEEMYPEEDQRVFDFGMLDKVMEGTHRPGHFNGVAQIVSKLFDVVQPDRAYFGEKDFQQLAIIRCMVKMSGYHVLIIACPIIREKDGLAMSSRNTLLNPSQRENAPLIARTLLESKEKIKTMPVDLLKKWVIEHIDDNPYLETEYFEIVDRDTLQPAGIYTGQPLQGCIAVRVGNIRLIDNIEY